MAIPEAVLLTLIVLFEGSDDASWSSLAETIIPSSVHHLRVIRSFSCVYTGMLFLFNPVLFVKKFGTP